MGAFGFDEAGAKTLVSRRFGFSEDLVEDYDVASKEALEALANATYTVPMENLDLNFDDIAPPNIGEAPAPDTLAEYESQMSEVNFPDLNWLRGILELAEVTIEKTDLPTLEAIAPVVSLPDAPDDALPDIPDEVPVLSDPAIPAVPDINLPDVPVLEESTLPNIPTIENITFEGVIPTADLTAPEPMFVYSEGTYQSDLADAIKTKLYSDVVNGGTGLAADVEQDIWDRALSRLNIELEKTYDQVLNNWAQWNNDMPDGVLSSALSEVLYEDNRVRLDANRDISYKQADLAQQNTQFAITNGLVNEKQLMDYTNQVNERAFAVARFRVQAVIDAFNIRVNAYNAQLEGYKSLAQVFESRIRAELSKVEIYRAQMEGAKIHGDLQAQKVEIYSRRIDALSTLIDLYRAQLEGAKLQVDVDSAKISAFKAKLDATVAKIQGVTAKYNLYQSQIAGETSKVDLYGRQVAAFASQVDASRVSSDVNLAEMRALIDANKDKVSILMAAIDKYKVDTQYQIGKEEANSRAYASKVGSYEAQSRREVEYIKAKVDAYRARIGEIGAEAELAIKEVDANLRAATALKEIQIEALKSLASITSQKVASALTSVSASAQVGFNESLANSTANNYNSSDSTAISETKSTSTGERTNHNYNYSV